MYQSPWGFTIWFRAEASYLGIPSDISLPSRWVDLLTGEVTTIDTHGDLREMCDIAIDGVEPET